MARVHPTQDQPEDIPTITFEEFLAMVRNTGVKADEDLPHNLPSLEAEQWALLAPYVGKPLKEIPKTLVLLFTSQTVSVRDGNTIQQSIRKLPAAEKQMREADEEEIFI